MQMNGFVFIIYFDRHRAGCRNYKVLVFVQLVDFGSRKPPLQNVLFAHGICFFVQSAINQKKSGLHRAMPFIVTICFMQIGCYQDGGECVFFSCSVFFSTRIVFEVLPVFFWIALIWKPCLMSCPMVSGYMFPQNESKEKVRIISVSI